MSVNTSAVVSFAPTGMEQSNVWSSWKTGGSDRTPSNYPCALTKSLDIGNGIDTKECGKSLILRETSCVPGVTASADGTGFVTTTWLPPGVCATRLGFATVSRKAIEDFNAVESKLHLPTDTCGSGLCMISCGGNCDGVNPKDRPEKTIVHAPYSVSQLFLDGKPLLHYFTGLPFYFKSESTPFLYLLPNKIMVRTGAGNFQVDTVMTSQSAVSCGNWTDSC